MKDMLTKMARELALANGAEFTVVDEPAHDSRDASLAAMAQALLKPFADSGIALLGLRREGSVLVARVNEDEADEPLCPRAFDRMVQRLSWTLLGQVWEGRLEVTFTQAPAPGPTPPAVPAALVMVA